MSSTGGRLRAVMASSAGIAIAMGLMNVGTYGYTIVAARLLGPRSYGGFAAVMGLLLVLGVLQLGLQATGARRIAAEPGDVGEIERTLLQVTYRSATVLALVTLALTPLIDAALHLESTATAALVSLTIWPMTVMGGQAGVLQGERRWLPLALLYMAAGVPRFLVGTLLLLVRPTETVATLAVALTFFAPVVVGAVALRRTAASRDRDTSGDHGRRAVLWETARNSQALLAFFALSNADVLLARGVLGGHQSGLYAGGLILSKAMLFLPQFVVVIAFPSMSNEGERRQALVRSITVVLGVGVLGAALTWLLSGWHLVGPPGAKVSLPLLFVGGPEYAEIEDRLWLFAVLGMLLSVIQLLVYSVVARQARFSVYLIWAVLLTFLVAGSRAGSVTALVVTVCLADGALFLMLLGISLWRLRTGPALDAEKAARAR